MSAPIPEDLTWLHERARWNEARIEYSAKHRPKSWDTPITLTGLIERLATLEAQLAEAQAHYENMWQQKEAVRIELADAQWKLITPEGLPKGYPYDECLHRHGYTGSLGGRFNGYTLDELLELGWTYYRAINPPAK